MDLLEWLSGSLQIAISIDQVLFNPSQTADQWLRGFIEDQQLPIRGKKLRG